MPRRRFRTRRTRRTRYRRRTFRARYPRGSVYRRRAMSNRTLTGLVKRLYRINEIRQVRSDLGIQYAPTTLVQVLSNCTVHPLTFPVALAAGVPGVSDSTFEGNTWQPVALKVRLQMSMNGTPTLLSTGQSSNFTYGGWVRQIIYQVKAGNATTGDPTSATYHELGGQGQFDTIAVEVKRRVLGSPATDNIASLATNYHNEPTSPLRVGIRALCRILSDKRWTFSSHGRQAVATRFRTRKPTQVKYVEMPPASANNEDDGDEIILPLVPSNQIYVMYIVNYDQATLQQITSGFTPQTMIAANYELVYRDA